MLYRKRPFVVEALQVPAEWDNSARELRFKSWLFNATWWPAPEINNTQRQNGLYIETSEGVMHASAGDWIIKDVKGEFYPCKKEIFDILYEPADVSAAEVEYI
jgi:hypothetical protein